MTTPEIPKDFLNRKNFFTLSGTAAAVWLFCLVISNLDPDRELISQGVYKFIALGISEALAIYLVIRDRRKTHKENYLIAVFNGLLIFLNASGYNAASNNLLFAKVEEPTPAATQVDTMSSGAGFLALTFFYNEADWWPNKKQEARIEQLEEKLKTLEAHNTDHLNQEEIDKEVNELLKQNSALEKELKQCMAAKSENPKYTDADIDYLNTERDNCLEERKQITKKYQKAFRELKQARDSLKLCVKFSGRLKKID